MKIVSRSEEVLGTVVEIKLPVTSSPLFPFLFNHLSEIEKRFSRFISTSELCKLNANLDVWQVASREYIYLLKKSKEFNLKTDGNFDVTLKSTLDALGYDKDYSFKTKPIATHSAVEKDFEIDEKNGKVRLYKEVDFGGIGKGYALDVLARILFEESVEHYYINAGGDIIAKKGKDKEPWVIILEHPDDSSMALGTVEIDGCSIAASSGNKRKWGDGLHHLINAKTKRPAMEVKAIFVVCPSGMEADVYATSIFCAGFKEGIELSKKLPVEILLISSENKMYRSKGFKAQLFT